MSSQLQKTCRCGWPRLKATEALASLERQNSLKNGSPDEILRLYDNFRFGDNFVCNCLRNDDNPIPVTQDQIARSNRDRTDHDGNIPTPICCNR